MTAVLAWTLFIGYVIALAWDGVSRRRAKARRDSDDYLRIKVHTPSVGPYYVEFTPEVTAAQVDAFGEFIRRVKASGPLPPPPPTTAQRTSDHRHLRAVASGEAGDAVA